jgi:GT2 family glycosyltransferase
MPSSHKHLRPRENGVVAPALYLEWAAPLVSQIAWAEVGPLDEEFGFFSMDIDWSYRAKQLGWRLAVDYAAVCDHLFRGTHNATKFSISEQGAKEHAHGISKYEREDWQEWLLGKAS